MQVSRILVWAIVLTLWTGPMKAAGSSGPDDKTVQVPEILLLGPIATPVRWQWPGESQKAGELSHLVRVLRSAGLPDSDTSLDIFGKSYTWRRAAAREGTFPLPEDGKGFWVASLTLDAQRWSSVKVKVKAPATPTLFVDGKKAALKEGEAHAARGDYPTGTHHLLLTFNKPDAGPGEIFVSLESPTPDALTAHTRPETLISARQLIAGPDIRGLKLSPDGREVLFSLRRRDEVGKRWETSVQLRGFDDGRLIQSWHAGNPRGLDWSPDGRWISYTTSGKGKSDLWIRDRKDGAERRLLHGFENLGSYRWSPDSRSIFFHWTKKADKRKDGVKRYRGLEDRWRGWRDRSQIFQVDATSGWVQQLTQSEWSSRLQDVSPDSNRVLYSRNIPDYGTPPFSRTVLLELEMESGQSRTVRELEHFSEARYRGTSLIVRAGPSAFDGAGRSLAAGRLANDYDSQLYLYHPDRDRAEPLSLDFAPSVDQIEVGKGGPALIRATDRARVSLYRLDVQERRFTALPSGLSVVSGLSYAPRSGRIAWQGSSPLVPARIYVADLENGEPRLFFDPESDKYRQTRLGEVGDWSFASSSGSEIVGRVYTPPRFDPSGKYPLIVYYYGGTVPVSDSFSSRYPWHLWAANGYVVYVLQPSGATGFGQEFSARHVNAWGKTTADEILEGTRKFVAAHPFVDGSKIGCIGASYGGFMTMYLVTRSDLFTAAVSHAGISSISSYWGEGNWGFAYSSIASRGSYPWNNPDLYVEQSPLFHADKVTTPLLLLHGDSDTNVPVGESHQMFTALKLLGKDVELVTIEGQDHHILDYDKKLLWWDTILAWFDKNLKEESDWWEALYPTAKQSD